MAQATSLFALAMYGLAIYRLWPDAAASRSTTLTIVLAWIAHLAVVLLALMGGVANLNLVNVANTVALIMVTMVGLSNVRLPVQSLYLILFPISIVTLTSTLVIHPGQPPQAADQISTSLIAHIVISLAAYSALMMAACQSVLLAVLERRLKEGRALTWLPALETMERLLLAMLWIGLAFLTAAIASGFVFLEDMFAQRVVHHTVITSASWLVYAAFLTGRYLFGWRGLTAVRWTLVAFALLVIGYLGSKFVFEYIVQT